MGRQTHALLSVCSSAVVLGMLAAAPAIGADRATAAPSGKQKVEGKPVGQQFPVASKKQAMDLVKEKLRAEYRRLESTNARTPSNLKGGLRAIPSNDDCANAIDVGVLPALVSGDTTEATDDSGAYAGTCGTGITSPGVWYTVTGTGNSITASLCSNTFYDSRINVFCGDCNSLNCVGGNDDSCSLQSSYTWCSEGGTTYYILVQGYNGDVGTFDLAVTDDGTPCGSPPSCGGGGGEPPANDYCDNAIDLGPLPATVMGTTIDATPDTDVSGNCGTDITAPGVWYTMLGIGSTVTASLCGGADYDTKISVFTGTCDGPVCVAGNDDFCDLVSEVSFCAEDGVPYFILVHGYEEDAGNFTLDVYDTGIPCVCPDICLGDETPEGEPDCYDEYDDVYNSGCNAFVTPAFTDIACGESVCGTAGTFLFTDPEFGLSEYRDTDWYKLVLASPQFVTVTMESSFNGLVGIVDTGGVDDCSGVDAFLTSDTVTRCTSNSVSANLGAGTWYVFCAPADFTGVACGSQYRVTVECDAPLMEACCFGDGSCLDLLNDDCTTAGGTPEGLGTTCDAYVCPVLPPNDLCEDAIYIPTVPGSVMGTTQFATTESFELDCPNAAISSPGVWYTVTGTGNTMTASICDGATPVDTYHKMSIYCGPSCDQLFCVNSYTNSFTNGCLDDSQSASWCSRSGETYYILVHGYAGSTFDFELTITDDGAACDSPPVCEPCSFTCTNPDAIPEGEPECYDEYDDVFNGGCNAFVTPVFSDIECGDVICGTSGNFLFTDPEFGLSEYRDTDWYRFTVTDRSLVTVRFQASFEGLIGIVDTGGVDDCLSVTDFLTSAIGGECQEISVSAVLDPGTWYVFASTSDFVGVSCGSAYELGLECAPVGGCCLPNPAIRAPCIETTEADCTAMHGVYLGNGMACGTFTYEANDCENGFEDISATGTYTGIGDETDLFVNLGFSFSFYGSNYTGLYISDNGYVTFVPITGTSYSNQVIPNPDNPNNLIAPMWDDLDPDSGGGVYYQTLGTAPFRRFIVQWDQVPQYFDVDSNTFEVVLYEDSNCIEFRYATITPEGFAGDYTIGVENQDGTAAVSLGGSVAYDGACVELCPVAGLDPCPHCVGDVNGDGKTDVFDFTILAAHYGQAVTPGTNGDLDGDGFVSVYDFSVMAADFTCGTLDAK